MPMLISKNPRYLYSSYGLEIVRLLAIEATLNEDSSTYKYLAMTVLITLISVRYSATKIEYANEANSQFRRDNSLRDQLYRTTQAKHGTCIASINKYFEEREITHNLMIVTTTLITTTCFTFVLPAAMPNINMIDVYTMQLATLAFAFIKLLIDSLLLTCTVKENQKELKREVIYSALGSTLTIIAAACVAFASNESIKLAGLILETLVALSIARNTYRIADQTIGFLKDKTKTWTSFYQEADPEANTLIAQGNQYELTPA